MKAPKRRMNRKMKKKDADEEMVDAPSAKKAVSGYGHIEFATHEAAQKAFEVNGEPLLDHPVKLDLAKEKEHTLPVPGIIYCQ
ncbi:putative nucleotide-binding alpha-beta plait domain superfamily, RNA-binding domain superfamily [Helianthus anomalus]